MELTLTLNLWQLGGGLLTVGGMVFLGWRYYLTLLQSMYNDRLAAMEEAIKSMEESNHTRVTDMQISTNKKINEKLDPIANGLDSVAGQLGELSTQFHKIDKDLAVVIAKQAMEIKQ